MGCDLIKFSTAMKSLQVSQLFGTSYKNLGGNQILKEFKNLINSEHKFEECLKLYHTELTDPLFSKANLNSMAPVIQPSITLPNHGKRLNPEDEEDSSVLHQKDLGIKRVKLSEDKALMLYQDKNNNSLLPSFTPEDLAALRQLHRAYNPLITKLIDSLRSSTAEDEEINE